MDSPDLEEVMVLVELLVAQLVSSQQIVSPLKYNHIL